MTDAITFSIGESYDYYYVIYYDALQIVERYQDGAIVMSGAVQAKGATGTIVGTFDGTIGVSARQNPLFRPFTASCNARTHGFAMVRR